MFSPNAIPNFLMTVVATALLAGGLPSAGNAQRVNDGLASIRPLMAEADSAMTAIERELAQIAEKKQIEDSGSILETNFDKAVQANDYAIMALSKAAREEAAQPRNLDLGGALAEFEKTALAQRDRAAAIFKKLAETQYAIHEGSILVSLKLFDGVSAKDRAAFLKSLSPAAQQTYKRLAPNRFSSMEIRLQELSDSVGNVIQSGLDACIPEAKASLAAGCLAFCGGSAGAACAACLVATAGTAYVLVRYTRCKSSCGSCKWYRPWACVCRAACFAAMVAVIAENSSPLKLAVVESSGNADFK
jgi:hypothetical protein